MPGIKRPRCRVVGSQAATAASVAAGAEVRTSRKRRRWSQDRLSKAIGISRAYLAKIEAGQAAGAALEVWFALGEALGRPFRAEFIRDRLEEPADVGHLAIQELVLQLATPAGYEGGFELPTRPSNPARSIDVALVDRRKRRLVIVECWNSFGDLGSAARSSNRKLAEGHALAAGLGWIGSRYEVGLCWVVRDTIRNRELIARYEHIFRSRLPGSSAGWVRALTADGRLPSEPGLVWCDARAMRLFARRTRHQAVVFGEVV